MDSQIRMISQRFKCIFCVIKKAKLVKANLNLFSVNFLNIILFSNYR